jgi:hypothetical protein
MPRVRALTGEALLAMEAASEVAATLPTSTAAAVAATATVLYVHPTPFPSPTTSLKELYFRSRILNDKLYCLDLSVSQI